jgi:hypothetical protein
MFNVDPQIYKLVINVSFCVVFKSCLDVQTYNKTHTDGEYPLQINYPTCNETVQIYCADMNSTQPLEYLTLKAGSVNNFSKKDYVGSSKQTTYASSKTEFSKVVTSTDISVFYVLLFVVSCRVVSCRVVSCHVVLCHVVLCRVMLCCSCRVMSCRVVSCCVMLCYVMLCYVMLCYVMLCYVVRVVFLFCVVRVVVVSCHVVHIVSFVSCCS